MLSLVDIQKKLGNLNGWALEENDIVRDFSFNDFKSALYFVNKVGELAELERHHPDIIINYNKVRLVLSTHEEHGLTEKDFLLAEKIDGIK
jgi:4a-hydroxytetrahydrobiopterin dehydratase